MTRRGWGVLLMLQSVLLGIELFSSYDTPERQLALALTNVLSIGGLWWLDRWLRRHGRRLSVLTAIVVLAGIWADALGNFQHFYGDWWWYDRLTHVIGGMAVTALFIDVIAGRLGQHLPWMYVLWYGFLIGQFVASMYEVSEWIGDELFSTARVRGPFDAPRDLLNNAIGGLLAVWYFWLKPAKK